MRYADRQCVGGCGSRAVVERLLSVAVSLAVVLVLAVRQGRIAVATDVRVVYTDELERAVPGHVERRPRVGHVQPARLGERGLQGWPVVLGALAARGVGAVAGAQVFRRVEAA